MFRVHRLSLFLSMFGFDMGSFFFGRKEFEVRNESENGNGDGDERRDKR